MFKNKREKIRADLRASPSPNSFLKLQLLHTLLSSAKSLLKPSQSTVPPTFWVPLLVPDSYYHLPVVLLNFLHWFAPFYPSSCTCELSGVLHIWIQKNKTKLIITKSLSKLTPIMMYQRERPAFVVCWGVCVFFLFDICECPGRSRAANLMGQPASPYNIWVSRKLEKINS